MPDSVCPEKGSNMHLLLVIGVPFSEYLTQVVERLSFPRFEVQVMPQVPSITRPLADLPGDLVNGTTLSIILD